MLLQLKKFTPLILPILLLIGIALRLVVYFQNRALMLDEANLALNIVEKNGWEFFQSLDYQQYCPPVFLLLSKWSSQLFGVQEWSLKLLPLLAGILLLVLLLKVAQQLLLSPWVVGYLLLVWSFSHLALRYSTELKQYSVDAFVALGLIYQALKQQKMAWNGKNSLFWMLLGNVALWTSMPSIFILATIGVAFLYENWKEKKRLPLGLMLTGGIWLLSFGVYFWLILYQDAQGEALQEYHAHFFFDLWPTSQAAWGNNLELGRILLSKLTDATVLGLILAGGLLLVGGYQLVMGDKFKALLFLLPLVWTILASHVGLYSFIPRLILFLIPILLITMGVGLDWLWQQSKLLPKLGIGVLLLISIINKQGYQHFWKKLEIENSREAIAYIAAHKEPKDWIYVESGAVPAFVFYNQWHQEAYQLQNFHLAKWGETPVVLLPPRGKEAEGKTWLLYIHTTPEKIAKELEGMPTAPAPPTLEYEGLEAAVYGWGGKE